MWTSTVTLADLCRTGRWKAEFFGKFATSVFASPYRMMLLSAIVEERREFLDPQDFPDHRFHYFGLENVESTTGDIVVYLPKNGREIKSRSKVVRPRDILYGRLRPYLNKVLYVDEALGDGICSGENQNNCQIDCAP